MYVELFKVGLGLFDKLIKCGVVFVGWQLEEVLLSLAEGVRLCFVGVIQSVICVLCIGMKYGVSLLLSVILSLQHCVGGDTNSYIM